MVLDGELDLATGRRLAAGLIAMGGPEEIATGIVADLTFVEFCDTAGLAALVAARDHFRRTGRNLVVRNPSATVAAMVDLFYGDCGLIERPDRRKECHLAC